jgi:alpha-tubulin suppressor-like RCC1 family protein
VLVRPFPLAVLVLLGCGSDPTGPEPASDATLAVGGAFSCLIGEQGRVSCWGLNAWGQLGALTEERCVADPCARHPVPVAPALAFRSLSASPASSILSGHVCGITTDGVAFCWGVDKTQLGRELSDPEICVGAHGVVGQPCSREPVPVERPGGLVTVASGDFHSCGVDPEGAVWCWGSHSNGQLGSGDVTPCGTFTFPCSFAPLRVVADRRFRTVAAGSVHSCALSEDGEAWCWGNNDDRQLGHEAAAGHHVPYPAAGGLRFIQVVAGRRHSCGLTPDGAIYCWGDNSGGQLGAGSSATTTQAVRVHSGTRFAMVSAGWWHTCALSTDGSAFCWGSNAFGQLGASLGQPETCAGAAACSTRPVRVAGGRRFTAIGAGGAHSCGLVAGGAAWCWGDNSLGQLGDDGEQGAARPVPVAAPGRS